MKCYDVVGHMIISVRCRVQANSPEEAKNVAYDCPVGSIADCINSLNRNHDDNVWVAEELDGEPEIVNVYEKK